VPFSADRDRVDGMSSCQGNGTPGARPGAQHFPNLVLCNIQSLRLARQRFYFQYAANASISSRISADSRSSAARSMASSSNWRAILSEAAFDGRL
jgi:hypothetical protein